MKKILLSTMLLTSALCLSAQNPQGHRPQRGHEPQHATPEMRAQAKTDQMKKTLDLTDEQYKALYELNLQEAQERQQFMRTQRQGNRPPRPEGGQKARPKNDRPQGDVESPAPLSREQLQENAQKREQEIQKILGEEKYARWQAEMQKMREARASRPAPERQ